MTDYELYTAVPWYNRRAQIKAVSIGNNVTTIGDLAFSHLEELTTVSIPDSVTSIGDHAFLYCKKLSSIDIPAKVTTIGLGAFYDCDSLISIDIPYGVKKIQDETFYSCGALTSVSIPNSVTSIGEDAFVICSSLTSVTIPDSVTSIQESAFQQCTKLQTVVFGKKVSSISYCAFYYCGNLRTIIFTGNAPSTIKSDSFRRVNAAAYYPPKDNTWTADKKANYGGTLTWLTWTCENLGQAHSVLVDKAIAPTCTEIGLAEGSHCDVCDKVLVAQKEIPALGHTWVDADCDTPKTCSVCGATEGAELGHDWVAADCDSPKTCDRCGATEGNAAGHAYSAGLCTACGNDTVIAILDETRFTLSGPLKEGTRILASGYDSYGRFSGFKEFLWRGNSLATELPAWEEIKLFFLDTDWVPLRNVISLK